jgi:peptidoglycan/LPS O-acetylase OafA/YrhL
MALRADSANLDFLRTNAVLLVTFFHLLIFFGKTQLGPLSVRPAMGFLGVFLFFVHTSLVLMFSLERQQEKLGNKTLFRAFMVRRIFRVYPLSVVAVVTTYTLSLPLGFVLPGRLVRTPMGAKGLMSNLLLLQNVTDSGSLLGPLWSLPYEMQMYLFLPALFLLARRVKSVGWLVLVWCGCVGLALVHARFGHLPDLVKYLPCFLPGVIAYKACSRIRPRFGFLGWPLLLLALYAAFMLEQGRDQGWLLCLITGLSIPQFAEMSNPFLRRASHLVAKYSYGIYLGHFFCMWLAFVRFHSLPLTVQWVVFAGALVAVCVTFYHLLEAPMIRVGNRLLEAIVVRSSRKTLAEGELRISTEPSLIQIEK